MRILGSLILGLTAVFGCPGCGTSTPTAKDDSVKSNPTDSPVRAYPIKVVATVGMVAELVRNVGREHVQVTQIMGAGVDPHLYKATRDDVQTIMSGDLVFYSGLLLEGKMADTLEKIKSRHRIYAVTEHLDEAYLISPGDNPKHHDPHVWMDVSAWGRCVEVVSQALSEYDPLHEADYRKNIVEYCEQLTELHKYGVTAVSTIPEGSRVLITSHDAFNYFGRAYGLEVLGIQGISTESEGGVRRINELVDLIVSKNVKAVFVESSVPPKNIFALIDGAKSRGQQVSIGGELYSDAMGPADTYEGTYTGMLDHNITLVTRGLGGVAPARGLYGKLKEPSAGGNP